ncbi:hypothetical protein [Streptomyces sp. NPDC001312]|uniref:hypothetical protein n=1 Tax=Streptomyces sp. NPDC001312 TaxID=3364561 RepID=UPI0036B1F61A
MPSRDSAEPTPEKALAPESTDSGSPWPTGHRFADRTRAKHATVRALLAAGHSRRSIQRQLGMTYRTVQRLADASPRTPEGKVVWAEQSLTEPVT